MNKETPKVELLPCPFCGCALEAYWGRANPAPAYCQCRLCKDAPRDLLAPLNKI